VGVSVGTFGYNISGFKMKSIFLKLVVFVMLLTLTGVQAAESDIFDQPITAKFQNTELSSAFKQLSEESGIQIIYDKSLSNKTVSGLYDNTPFLNVIQRMLSRENHTLTMDRQRKILFVRGFGESQYVSTDISPDGRYMTDLGIPLDKLRALHVKQTEEYVQSSNNMDEFLDELGMTRGELRRMQEKQGAQFEQQEQNPDQFLAELNMTRGQMQKMLTRQLNDYEQEISDDNAVISETGMTRGQQHEMLKNQALKFEEQRNNDAEFLPEIGMTRGEHKRLLTQQSKKFEDHLTL